MVTEKNSVVEITTDEILFAIDRHIGEVQLYISSLPYAVEDKAKLFDKLVEPQKDKIIKHLERTINFRRDLLREMI